ncbi:hypothetical protein CMI40_00590 [Candidatus Pacearchaeota archaeon]|jgi:hypothetical protein|nr:hypothetical protein [Candidatus Pacearchaeota archaeon]|tara:strand:+ start:125 stop:430 length:306 start_codon:yes stop_codon:yes gene_type:complete
MVSLLTALTIQENKAEVAVYQGENKKYGFEIYSIIRDKYRPHITSEPVFDSEQNAEDEGKKLCKTIESLNLDKKRKELSNFLGDDAKIVQEIIDESKSKSR